MSESDLPTAGRLVDGTHHLPIRIYFEDTDAGGVVYHARYLHYFERARWEFLAACGADHLAALEAGEGTYVVAEASLSYRRPAKLGDALVIVSRLIEVRGSSALVQQQVMRDRLLLVEGRIRVAFVAPGGKPRRQPATWVEAFRANMGAKSAE